MKILPIIILAGLLSTVPAVAQEPEINDMIGLLDNEWGSNCASVAFLDHILMDVYLFCPSYPFITGLEFGLEITGRANTALTPSFPVGPSSDLIWDTNEPGFVDITLLFATPFDASESVLLGTIDVFFLDSGEIDFQLTAASPSSLSPPSALYLADPGGVLVPVTTYDSGSDWDFQINGTCNNDWFPKKAMLTCGPLDNQVTSWSTVKALYR